MDEKIITLKRRMAGIIDDITTHTVSAEWYRWYIDMDYTSQEVAEFKYTPIKTLCDKLEI